MSFNSLFSKPVVVPDLNCGEVDFTEVPLDDDHDAHVFMLHMRHFSHNSATHLADKVRSINLGGCNLNTLSHYRFGQFLECVKRFINLERIRVSRCHLASARVVMLMNVIKYITPFAMPQEHAGFSPTSMVTRTLSTLSLGSNDIDDHTITNVYSELGMPLNGVGTLSIMGCGITDASIVPISNLFPSLQKLLLCNTYVEGVTMSSALKNLRSLNVLGLDGSHVAGDGALEILDAMVSRSKMQRVVPLEVWLRGVHPPDDQWSKLLAFSSNAKNVSNFAVKHDLLVSLAVRPRHVVQVYDSIAVRVRISGLDPFVIPYERIVCSKSVLKMAKEAVDELNMIAMGDDKDVNDKMIMKRRRVYREVFAHLFETGYFMNKAYKVGVVQFTRINRFTNDREMTYAVGHSLLGPPSSDSDYELDVEAEQVAPVQLNAEGARVLTSS